MSTYFKRSLATSLSSSLVSISSISGDEDWVSLSLLMSEFSCLLFCSFESCSEVFENSKRLVEENGENFTIWTFGIGFDDLFADNVC